MSVLIERPGLRFGLALIWMMLSDSYTLAAFVSGLIAATVVVALLPAPVARLGRMRIAGLAGFFRWGWAVLRLLGYFIWELLVANVQVARLVMKRNPGLRPGIITMHLRASTPGQIALLTALMILTPGSIVVDVSATRDRMFIHVIDASDIEAALLVPRRFENMILEVVR